MARAVLWTASQRAVLIGVSLSLFVILTAKACLYRRDIADPQPPMASRAGELADRIDPNTADAPTLAALPLIGPKRARDIVIFRERFISQNPHRVAFARPEDLLRVKGIGVATIAQLETYLIFPPTSAPAP